MDARQLLEAAQAWAQANPNIVIPILVLIVAAIAKRLRWTPEMIFSVTRAAYRFGANGKGFGAWLSSVLVPALFAVEASALPLAIVAGIRPRGSAKSQQAKIDRLEARVDDLSRWIEGQKRERAITEASRAMVASGRKSREDQAATAVRIGTAAHTSP